MAWPDVAGHIYVSGLLSATDMNTFVKDALLDLHRRTSPEVDFVPTNETTNSTTYTNLATPGPAVVVEIGSTGKALVSISAHYSNDAAGAASCVSYGITGATNSPATDSRASIFNAPNPLNFFQLAMTVMHGPDGGEDILAVGLTTFTMKYRVFNNNGIFDSRRILVTPLGS